MISSKKLQFKDFNPPFLFFPGNPNPPEIPRKTVQKRKKSHHHPDLIHIHQAWRHGNRVLARPSGDRWMDFFVWGDGSFKATGYTNPQQGSILIGFFWYFFDGFIHPRSLTAKTHWKVTQVPNIGKANVFLSHDFFRGELLNFGGVQCFKERNSLDSLKIHLGVSTLLSKKYIYKNKTTKPLGCDGLDLAAKRNEFAERISDQSHSSIQIGLKKVSHEFPSYKQSGNDFFETTNLWPTIRLSSLIGFRFCCPWIKCCCKANPKTSKTAHKPINSYPPWK